MVAGAVIQALVISLRVLVIAVLVGFAFSITLRDVTGVCNFLVAGRALIKLLITEAMAFVTVVPGEGLIVRIVVTGGYLPPIIL
jgi:hypothetical protein